MRLGPVIIWCATAATVGGCSDSTSARPMENVDVAHVRRAASVYYTDPVFDPVDYPMNSSLYLSASEAMSVAPYVSVDPTDLGWSGKTGSISASVF